MKKENKLIAEFMGMTAHHQDKGCMIFMTPQGHNDIVYVNDLKYHTSWDWLMTVVEKIEDMGYEIVITNGECTISGANDYYAESIGKSRRGATYNAVIHFINEYNKNK